MRTVLVTGATTFLGYHVVKRLNELGVRPRVLELPGSRQEVLDRLDVERCAGDLGDPGSIQAACTGAHTLLHFAFKVSVGGGDALIEEQKRVNVAGTMRLLDAAAAAGVARTVVTGSALAVGVNREPAPLDESAGAEHLFDLPYANIRRDAEFQALARTAPGFDVMSVCPSFTFGPDDPIGAPGNKLLAAIASRKLRFRLTVGFGCLDVRDFASGVLLAAEHGRAGERYLLSGENVTADELLQRVGALSGVRPPRFTPPTPLLHALAGALEAWCRLRGKPAPLTRAVLQVVGRYAWYDTDKARTQLGWNPRPLQQTLADTLQWQRAPAAAPPKAAPL